MEIDLVWTEAVGRYLVLRHGDEFEDKRVWGDTFTSQYHVPPASMPAPATVLDLGANIGLTAAHYKALWPDAEVVAIELDGGNAEIARKNGVNVCHEAVSDDAGISSYDGRAATDAYALSRQGQQIVMANTLRTIILRSFDDIQIVADFVKMDIEGMEWRLFAQTDWVPLVRNLLVELHGEDLPAQLVRRAIAQLSGLGFKAEPHRAHPAAVFASRP